MNQLEAEIVDAFRLITANGLVSLAADFFRTRPDLLPSKFDGLLPAQDTEAQRASTTHVQWPPANIRPLIERVGTGTLQQYLDQFVPIVHQRLPQQVFILITTAVDSFLDRRTFAGTLGQKFRTVQERTSIPLDTEADLHEIIQRRNDVAHGGGAVSSDYISAKRYPRLHASSWIRSHGVPTVGMVHVFDIEYLYWACSSLYELCRLVP